VLDSVPGPAGYGCRPRPPALRGLTCPKICSPGGPVASAGCSEDLRQVRSEGMCDSEQPAGPRRSGGGDCAILRRKSQTCGGRPAYEIAFECCRIVRVWSDEKQKQPKVSLGELSRHGASGRAGWIRLHRGPDCVSGAIAPFPRGPRRGEKDRIGMGRINCIPEGDPRGWKRLLL
jgi:hypothetical protein